MFADITTAVFYLFATVLTGAALAVISAKNPVHAVFFLILAFFNAAGLFVLLGAEYLAMTLVIVYVGAVAVLFLFVVMMMNINFERFRASFIHYLPIGLIIALLLFMEIGALIYLSFQNTINVASPAIKIPDAEQISNVEAIGRALYTQDLILFELSGVILLVAMIGAIVLTLRHRPGVRKQKIYKQISRKRSESVTIVSVETGKGV
jgi:NADH-quinone oxidoreductase subunit J